MMEALSRLLERAVGGACRGLQLGIMQLRYLDRCVFFVCVCVCVCVFSGISSLKINLGKSKIVLVGDV